jgi:hypothetical protein
MSSGAGAGERRTEATIDDYLTLRRRFNELDYAFHQWRQAAYAAGLDPERHRRELAALKEQT